MNPKVFFVLSTMLSLLFLIANKIDARKDLGETRRIVMKNQEMPESTVSKTEANCYEDSEHKMEKPFAKNFEPMLDVSNYDNGMKSIKTKAFVKDFELMPGVSVYDNPNQQKSFVKNFEQMPDVTIYDNGIKPTKQRLFVKEVMSDVPIYDNDIKPTNQRSFVRNFELMPDLSIYEPTKQKSMAKNLVEPDVTIYHS